MNSFVVRQPLLLLLVFLFVTHPLSRRLSIYLILDCIEYITNVYISWYLMKFVSINSKVVFGVLQNQALPATIHSCLFIPVHSNNGRASNMKLREQQKSWYKLFIHSTIYVLLPFSPIFCFITYATHNCVADCEGEISLRFHSLSLYHSHFSFIHSISSSSNTQSNK